MSRRMIRGSSWGHSKTPRKEAGRAAGQSEGERGEAGVGGGDQICQVCCHNAPYFFCPPSTVLSL